MRASRRLAIAVYRVCQRKRRYVSVHEAEDAAIVLWLNTGDEVYPYPCDHCHGFHIGHRPGFLAQERQESA